MHIQGRISPGSETAAQGIKVCVSIYQYRVSAYKIWLSAAGQGSDINMKLKLYMGLFFLLLSVSGCQQFAVESYSDPQFEPAKIETYAWLPNGSMALGVAPERLAVIQDTLESSINDGLQRKGWQLRDPQSADIWVRYVAGAESQYEVKSTGTSRVAGQEVEVPVEVKKMRSGRLAIDLIDSETGRIVWRGVSGATREGVGSQTPTADMVRRIVRSILQRLPS